MRFAVDKVALGQFFSPNTLVSPVSKTVQVSKEHLLSRCHCCSHVLLFAQNIFEITEDCCLVTKLNARAVY